MTLSRTLFSSAKGTWETPDDLYRELDNEFHFTMDASSTKDGFDALKDEWQGNVYCNPPYGPDVWWWLDAATRSTANIIVFLLPARTDTRWFHDFVLPFAKEIRFIKGRLKFKGAQGSAPFPSMIVVFR